jgi:formamidopyrimidine-DNA glycosylase
MPELPDIVVYLEALRPRILGRTVERVRIGHPLAVRSWDPPIREVENRRVRELRRIGKRIVLGLDENLFLVIHLMIAGRLRWRDRDTALSRRGGLAAFDFPHGALLLTEAGTKRRASIHVVRGEAGLAALDPGGASVFELDVEEFRKLLGRERHTLKRALTDPRLLDGIGAAYADEILHAARLSPFALTTQLDGGESEALLSAIQQTLSTWIERLSEEAGDAFPEKVSAFREGMAIHGRYREPCPACGSPIQRIRYAENETNYCATCQTKGKVYADRALSRLLREDWPRTIEEWERVVGSPE